MRMNNFRLSRGWSGLLLAVGLLTAACGGNSTNDASTDTSPGNDSGAHDGNNTDASSEAASDVATNDASDSSMADIATDVPADNTPVDSGPGDTGPGDTGPGDSGPGDSGGTCTSTATLDPARYFTELNSVQIFRADFTNLGDQAAVTYIAFANHVEDPTAPLMTQGNCAMWETQVGTMARANSTAYQNYGPTTATVGTATVPFTWDTTMGDYNGDTSAAQPLPLGQAAMLAITGLDPQQPGTASTMFPAQAFLASNIHQPTTWTRATDNVLSWDIPAEATTSGGSDLVATMMQDDGAGHVIICVAPACAGSLTVPHQLTEGLPTGSQMFMWVGMERSVDVSGTRTPPVVYEVGVGAGDFAQYD